VSDLPRLVCRPRPFTDESLLSYLLRLQAANGYDRMSWLTSGLQAWTGLPTPPRLANPQNLAFLEALAAVTAVATSALYRMTLHRYATVLLPPETPLRQAAWSDGSSVALAAHPHRVRPDGATAFCPHCLASAHYHRLRWLLVPVFACVHHGCWLRETCACCGASVSIAAVTEGRCRACQTELAAMPTVALDTWVAVTQTALDSALESGRFPTGDGLPALTAPACFRLLDGLMVLARQLGWSWVGHGLPVDLEQLPFPALPSQALRVPQWGSLYASAWEAVQDWPQGFEALLEAYRQQPKSYAGGGIRRELGYFYGVWLEKNWNHPDLALVQAAFNQYFVAHFPPSREMVRLKRMQQFPELRQQFAYIDVRNAARSLGVSPPKITRLVRDGYIRVYPEREAHRPGMFVYRADLETALTEREAFLEYQDAATELHITFQIIHDWLAAGLLQPSARRRLHGEELPALCRADLAAFRRRLAPQVRLSRERPMDAVNLKETCARNGKVGLTATQVIERILAGKLPAYHPDPELQPFGALWFAAADVAALTEQVKQEKGWMGFLEVWRWFPVGRETIHRWIAAGLLVPVATFARALYFDRRQVEQFRQSLQASHEVMSCLETSGSALSQWVRAGLLSVVNHSGRRTGQKLFFDRTVVEHFHRQYITPCEIRRRWGEKFWLAFQHAVRTEQFRSFPDEAVSKIYLRTDVETFASPFEQ
jgi:TniQ